MKLLYELWIGAAVIAFLLNKNKKVSLPEFRYPLWLLLPIFIQILAMLVHTYVIDSKLLFMILIDSSYLILIIAIWLNRHIPGFWIFLIGVVLNAVVIWFNQGRMPVSLEALRLANLDYLIADLREGVEKHLLINENTIFPFLGDVIPLIRPYAGNKTISIGDVIQSLGITLWIWKVFRGYKF